jgi:hypothetical protein
VVLESNFFCGSQSITYKHHIQKSRCDNVNFWRKKNQKNDKINRRKGLFDEYFCNLAKKYGKLQSRAPIIFVQSLSITYKHQIKKS